MPHSPRRLLTCAALFALPAPALAQIVAPEPPAFCGSTVNAGMDGQKDFDWEVGAWTTHVERLRKPLSGSTEWVEYEGTTDVRPLMGGRANLAELRVEGPAGRIEGVSLRLYNPETHLWSLNFASAGGGVLTPAPTGGFADGCGEFYVDDSWNSRPIRVRFVIVIHRPDFARFEQAFSADGGKSWEVNWIATDTRRRP
jgi:hypothetical protein